MTDDINPVLTPKIILPAESGDVDTSVPDDPTDDFGVSDIEANLDFDLTDDQRRRLNSVYGGNPVLIADATVDRLEGENEGEPFFTEEQAGFLDEGIITREQIQEIIDAAQEVVDENDLDEAVEEREERQEEVDEALDDARIEVQPVYTETFRATTENDNRVHKTLCGQRKVESIGEDEWRITIEGVVTESQLLELIEMRPANNELKIIANPIGHKYNSVTFDRFTYEITDELNRGDFGDGAEPLAEFQLQTQDDDAP